MSDMQNAKSSAHEKRGRGVDLSVIYEDARRVRISDILHDDFRYTDIYLCFEAAIEDVIRAIAVDYFEGVEDQEPGDIHPIDPGTMIVVLENRPSGTSLPVPKPTKARFDEQAYRSWVSSNLHALAESVRADQDVQFYLNQLKERASELLLSA